jgi:hypothetical protein
MRIKKRRKYKNYKIERYHLKSNFVGGIFVGAVAMLFYSSLSPEEKNIVLKSLKSKMENK